MYDIEDDRVRGKIADDCKDAGLERVQYSVFRGTLTRTHRSELIAKLTDRLGRPARPLPGGGPVRARRA